jgi:hypothetical protein
MVFVYIYVGIFLVASCKEFMIPIGVHCLRTFVQSVTFHLWLVGMVVIIVLHVDVWWCVKCNHELVAKSIKKCKSSIRFKHLLVVILKRLQISRQNKACTWGFLGIKSCRGNMHSILYYRNSGVFCYQKCINVG